MGKLRTLAAAIALVVSGVGQAQEHPMITVERRASPAGTIVGHTVGGALAGSAVSGLVIGYELGIHNNGNYDWGRTLGIGAVIGASLGLVWGIVDATSGPNHAATPLAPVRDGWSETLDARKKDLSHQMTFGIFARRF
jgi:hypothetical protein